MSDRKYKPRKIIGNVVQKKDGSGTFIKLFRPDEIQNAERGSQGEVLLTVSDPRRALSPEQLQVLEAEGKVIMPAQREGGRDRTLYNSILFDLYINLKD